MGMYKILCQLFLKHRVLFAGDEEENLEKYFLSMQKLLDISKIKKLGWKPNIALKTAFIVFTNGI